MQVPEKLALIGGSILLSSTLIFTLKSQASTIIPKISNSVGSIYQDLTDTQADHGVSLPFDESYQYAQKKGWKTGTWGTAKYYIDDKNNMYVGKGNLPSHLTLRNMLGDGSTDVLHTLNIVQPVQAPSDSSNLFSTSDGFAENQSSLEQINGLENVDTSQVTSMFNMFTNDYKLEHINGVENWDTSHVDSMPWMFYHDSSLQDINVSHWNVNNVQDMGYIFANDTGLNTLDLSGWSNDKLPNSNSQYGHGFWGMLDNVQVQKFVLGDRTRISFSNLPTTNWKNGDQSLTINQLGDNNFHPGTWIRQ